MPPKKAAGKVMKGGRKTAPSATPATAAKPNPFAAKTAAAKPAAVKAMPGKPSSVKPDNSAQDAAQALAAKTGKKNPFAKKK